MYIKKLFKDSETVVAFNSALPHISKICDAFIPALSPHKTNILTPTMS